jgi:hypothetical protein
MNSPEWTIILAGCLVCAMSGGTQIAFAILLTNIVNVSGLSL